jgi:hypothetical protein
MNTEVFRSGTSGFPEQMDFSHLYGTLYMPMFSRFIFDYFANCIVNEQLPDCIEDIENSGFESSGFVVFAAVSACS